MSYGQISKMYIISRTRGIHQLRALERASTDYHLPLGDDAGLIQILLPRKALSDGQLCSGRDRQPISNDVPPGPAQQNFRREGVGHNSKLGSRVGGNYIQSITNR